MVLRPDPSDPDPAALPASRDSRPPPLLLSGAKAAELLGISRSLFYRWDAQGVIPRAVQIGRKRRWSRLELIRWVERRCPPRHAWESDR